jgi:alkylhydroperoxidase family enzyme
VTEDQLHDINRYRESSAFTDEEKLLLAYTDAMTATPVDVGDELFEALRRVFDDPQLVELTAMIAQENWRGRFNHALHIGAQGFSQGAFCPLPAAESE